MTQLTKTIWIVGPEGSGKTTLLLLFPLAALHFGRILLPQDDTTERFMYEWQDNFFVKGQFPPSGNDQSSRHFTFEYLTKQEWEEYHLKGLSTPKPRTLEVWEHTCSRDNLLPPDPGVKSIRSGDLGLIYCIGADNMGVYPHVERLIGIVENLHRLRQRKVTNLCLAVTKADLEVHDHPGMWSNTVTPGGGPEDRILTIAPQELLRQASIKSSGEHEAQEVQQQSKDWNMRVSAYVQDLMDGVGNDDKQLRNIRHGLHVCTAVGVVRSESDGQEVPNVQQTEHNGFKVLDRLQIGWNGIGNLFTDAYGEVRA